MTKAFLHCELCNKEFSGPEPYTQHVLSKAHLKKSSQKVSTTFESCSSTHVEPYSAAHAVPYSPTYADPIVSTNTELSSNNQKFRCDTCQVDISGPAPWAQHMNGSKHKSMLNKKRIIEEYHAPNASQNVVLTLQCPVCEKCFSGPESFEQHMKSKKHIRKVELANMKERLASTEPASCPPINTTKGVYRPLANLEVPNKSIVKKDQKKPVGCFGVLKSMMKKKNKKN